MKYWIIDELSKIDPQSGKVTGGTIQKSPEKLVAAGNEFVSFQLIINPENNEKKPVRINVKAKGISADVKIYREHYVPIHGKYYPDPLVPFKAGTPIPISGNYSNVPNQKYHAFWIDLFIPSSSKAGDFCIDVNLVSGEKQVAEIKIPLTVLTFTLPDRPSFTLEYNNYGNLNTAVISRTREESLAFQATAEYEKQLHNHHRLAREHWGTVNVLGYGQNGNYSQSMAPVLNSDTFLIESFKNYDKRFGPFLDGSAFKSGYGKGVPVSDFYLPFNYTWPAPWGYFPSESYQEIITAGIKAFDAHIKKMGWNKTNFHLMINHKSRRSIIPYNGDEPTRIKDYGMLKYYLTAVNKGKPKNSRIHARLDVGHYECDHIMDECDWIGNERKCVHSSVLNGYSDFWVTSISHGKKESLEKRRKRGEIVWLYQGASTISRPLSDQAQVLLEVYRKRAVGYCFWSCNSWSGNPWKETGKRLGFDYLFYPGMDVGINEPLPSLRLKAARRTAMDIEYLEHAVKTGKGGKAIKRLNDFVAHYAPHKIDFMDDNVSNVAKVDFLKGDTWKSFRTDILNLISSGSSK
ncbi:MAG: DUF4091 domain-containing protein [Fibrobacteres bacterium]|nr:DUF4091 domain-containing protein [Fibrobacterota bacterium]